MARIEIHTPAHKALRAQLFATAQLVARSDFADPAEISAVGAAWSRLAALLDGHARRVDEHVVPLLARLSPLVAAEIETRFDRCRGLERGIAGIVTRLERATPAERVSLRRRLHRSMGPLVVDHLTRMEVEEQHATRILGAHLGDEELARLEVRMLASMSAPEAAGWLTLVVAAAGASESAALLTRLRSHVASETWPALADELRERLGSARWTTILGPPCVHAGESAGEQGAS